MSNFIKEINNRIKKYQEEYKYMKNKDIKTIQELIGKTELELNSLTKENVESPTQEKLDRIKELESLLGILNYNLELLKTR